MSSFMGLIIRLQTVGIVSGLQTVDLINAVNYSSLSTPSILSMPWLLLSSLSPLSLLLLSPSQTTDVGSIFLIKFPYAFGHSCKLSTKSQSLFQITWWNKSHFVRFLSHRERKKCNTSQNLRRSCRQGFRPGLDHYCWKEFRGSFVPLSCTETKCNRCRLSQSFPCKPSLGSWQYWKDFSTNVFGGRD